MDGFTQVNRILAIDTPLGPDRLLLEALEGHEGVSSLFQFRATVRATFDDLDPAALIAQPVDFHLRLAEGSYRSFNGIVAGLVAGHAAGRGQRHYELEIVPWLWLLTRTSDCRIFQNKTSLEILATIFDEMGHSQYDFSMAGSPPPRPYCVQYRETDFAFVCRLLEEDGLYYFFRHEPGKHTLVVASQTQAYQAGAEPMIPFSATSSLSNHIKDWRRRHAYQASAWTVADYNFETSKLRLNQTVPTLSKFQQQPQHEHFDFPGLHGDPGGGERRAKLNMQAEEVERETIQGASDARTLAPIGRFQMSGHPVLAENGSYVVLSVSHKAADQSYESIGGGGTQYENSFTCMPAATPFVPKRVTPRPTIPGLQTAIVVGPKGDEIHTDAYGRVKVQFYWDRRGSADDRSSCWIRAAQSWAGRGFGAQTIPRVGMEVVIGFMEGNPDRPVILGSVPNSETSAPLSLPAQKTQTAFRTTSSPGGSGFNLFSMEDKAGSEELAFHSQKDLSMVVQNNQFIQIGNAAIQRAKNLLVLQVGESAIQFTGDQIILTCHDSTMILDKTGISQDGTNIWLNLKEKLGPLGEDPMTAGGVGAAAAAGAMMAADGTPLIMTPQQKTCAELAEARDKAVLANHTYGSDPTIPPGYRLLDPATPEGRSELAGLGVSNDMLAPASTDFRAQVFAKEGAGGTDYVVAYRGTQTLGNWKNNLQQGLGAQSEEYNQAINLARRMQKGSEGRVSFTGHSLGGGMASAASVVTGRPATTFNAAGLHAATVGNYPATPAPVDAYFNEGDPLSALQDNREGVLAGMTAGLFKVNPLLGAGLGGFIGGNEVAGTPVLPRAYGTRHALPRVPPPDAGFLQRANPIAPHGMDYVVRGIDAQRQQNGCL